MNRQKAERIAALIIDLAVEFELIIEDGTPEQVPTPALASVKPAGGRKAAAPKPPLDTTAAAAAPPPGPPAPAETAVSRTMMPVCAEHAKTLGANIRPIPAEPSACTMCINDRTAAKSSSGTTGKSMTMEEAKAIANSLIAAHGGDEGTGSDVVWGILQSMGVESLTGGSDGKSSKLDPAQYESFAKQCLAAMPAAPATAPARRAL